jgi:hypothetical protein
LLLYQYLDTEGKDRRMEGKHSICDICVGGGGG